MRFLALIPVAGIAAIGAVAMGAQLQPMASYSSVGDTRSALEEARKQQAEAQALSERLEQQAELASEAVEKTARQSAAIAARLQETEAGMAAANARIALVDRERADLRARLAERQRPLIKLTGALQNFTRRPLAISALRPGSLQETVHLRAILDSAVPEVRRRTAGLRSDLNRARELQQQALAERDRLTDLEGQLEERRGQLAAIESRQRIEQRQAGAAADRETERALALAEQARDLDALVSTLESAGSLRAQLAALPGPLIRPERPTQSEVVAQAALVETSADRPPAPYRLPVVGRTVAGFGAPSGAGTSQGIVIAPAAGAVVTSPAAGRVAFAGPYRGYGRIVIIEHGGGWASLVTGLARSDVSVGQELVAGAPLGIAPRSGPQVSLELRRNGQPVNPLPYTG